MFIFNNQRRNRRTLEYNILLYCAVILIWATFFSTAQAAEPAYCNKYAANAIKQFHEAKLAGIPNLVPPVWQDNKDAHYGWCLSVSNNEVDKGFRLRQDILDKHFALLNNALKGKMIVTTPIYSTSDTKTNSPSYNPSHPSQTHFPDLQITKQWIEHMDIKCGPTSDYCPTCFSGSYPKWPLTTSASYIFHVEIQNVGDGLLPVGQSFVVTTACVRDNKRFTLGSGYTAISNANSTFATYVIYPGQAGEGECLIETEVDSLDHIKEAIEGNNKASMGDYTWDIHHPFNK